MYSLVFTSGIKDHNDQEQKQIQVNKNEQSFECPTVQLKIGLKNREHHIDTKRISQLSKLLNVSIFCERSYLHSLQLYLYLFIYIGNPPNIRHGLKKKLHQYIPQQYIQNLIIFNLFANKSKKIMSCFTYFAVSSINVSS